MWVLKGDALFVVGGSNVLLKGDSEFLPVNGVESILFSLPPGVGGCSWTCLCPQEDQLGLSLLTLEQLQSEDVLQKITQIAHQTWRTRTLRPLVTMATAACRHRARPRSPVGCGSKATWTRTVQTVKSVCVSSTSLGLDGVVSGSIDKREDASWTVLWLKSEELRSQKKPPLWSKLGQTRTITTTNFSLSLKKKLYYENIYFYKMSVKNMQFY